MTSWLLALALLLGGASDEREACVAFTGDLMHHCTQATGASLQKKNGFDYRRSFALVKPLLVGADLAVGNLEVPVDGSRKDCCYPRFSAPAAYLDALQDAGFDVLSLANNHAMDRLGPGLERTRKRISERGMLAFGTTADPAVVTREANGIRFGFLACTELVNVRPRQAKLRPVQCKSRKQRQAFIEAVRSAAATHDAVIAYVHWGTEWSVIVPRRNRRFAAALAEAGAIAIIGHHTHVLGPSTFLQNGTYVRYGLGNLVAAMVRFPARLAGVETLCFRKRGGETRLTQVSFVPTWIRRSAGPESRIFQATPLRPAAAQCRAKKGPLPKLNRGECREILRYEKWLRKRLRLSPHGL